MQCVLRAVPLAHYQQHVVLLLCGFRVMVIMHTVEAAFKLACFQLCNYPELKGATVAVSNTLSIALREAASQATPCCQQQVSKQQPGNIVVCDKQQHTHPLAA